MIQRSLGLCDCPHLPVTDVSNNLQLKNYLMYWDYVHVKAAALAVQV